MGYKRFILILVGAFILTTTLIMTAAVKISDSQKEDKVAINKKESREPLATFLHETPRVNIKDRAEELGKSVVDGYSLFSFFSPEAFGVNGAPEIIEGPHGESPEEMDQLIAKKIKPYGFVKEYEVKKIKQKGNYETVQFEFITAKEKVYDVTLLFNKEGLVVTKILKE
ncbi:hypothetical protein QK289_13155 [Exiguobacterium antarcticum]|uniref:DUF4309 domain-containing protein n=1 Tax=Exiguobacterium antarcticum TaxID=132920 RepID=A0ABT6R4S1_9BACL|nr:hypothetical protein [Exiguobacterium antarcticum]MDI3235958.1 hypothetical protein [Exiguobacterium antarcticum]